MASPAAARAAASETAPGSGVPRLRSPWVAARPRVAASAAVPVAPSCAAGTAPVQAVTDRPPTPRGHRRTGPSASMSVLSPGRAPPRRFVASRAAPSAAPTVATSSVGSRTPSAVPRGERRARPSASSPAPQRAPDAPPAASAKARAAASTTSATVGPAWAAAVVAADSPRTIPAPWSPVAGHGVETAQLGRKLVDRLGHGGEGGGGGPGGELRGAGIGGSVGSLGRLLQRAGPSRYRHRDPAVRRERAGLR